MLGSYSASVVDDGPTSAQHCVPTPRVCWAADRIVDANVVPSLCQRRVNVSGYKGQKSIVVSQKHVMLTQRCFNVGQRVRRWPNIKTTLVIYRVIRPRGINRWLCMIGS